MDIRHSKAGPVDKKANCLGQLGTGCTGAKRSKIDGLRDQGKMIYLGPEKGGVASQKFRYKHELILGERVWRI